MKHHPLTALRRALRLIQLLARLRSISSARWVDAYENHQPRLKEWGAA